MSEKIEPTGARRFGYFVSIVINGLLLYAANNLHLWDVPYLTASFSKCLWAINLSIGVSIFMYCIFMVFDRRWFRSFMQAITNVFSFVSLYVFRQVFPLELPENAIRWVNFGMVILLVLIALSVVVEFSHAIRNYRQSLTKE